MLSLALTLPAIAIRGQSLWSPFKGPLSAWWSSRDLSASPATWLDRVAALSLAPGGGAGTESTWGATSFNSVYPGLTFDGTDDRLETASTTGLPTAATSGLIYLLANITSSGAAFCPIGYGASAGANAARRLVKSNTTLAQMNDSTETLSGTGTNCSGVHVLVGRWTSSTMEGWLDGTAFAGNPETLDVTLNTGTSRVRVGANNAGVGGTTQIGAMVLSDILITPDNTTDERQRNEGFLAWRGGIQSSLAATHPYRSRHP
jgi:hypothetical protein